MKEQVIKLNSKKYRPFSELAGVHCRCYSRKLQRVIVDFGADVSFRQTQEKIKEHYSIEIPISGIQFVTENHAKMAYEYIENESFAYGKTEILVGEMDGSMIPIVETSMLDGFDSRKCRKVRWQEAKLCMSRNPEKVEAIFYATLVGGVERAGDLLYRAALKAGFGAETKIHCIGDGARWILDQVRRVFGSQGSYLVDFYHISQYLSDAAEHSWTSQKLEWRQEQQELLKQNKYQEVLKVIRKRLPIDFEAQQKSKKSKKRLEETILEKKIEETPVEKCYRYIANRQGCLDYKTALEKNLPIGSGEVESGHKSVIQQRMKITGAWWREDNAENMLALRSLRANGDWQNYWAQQAA